MLRNASVVCRGSLADRGLAFAGPPSREEQWTILRVILPRMQLHQDFRSKLLPRRNMKKRRRVASPRQQRAKGTPVENDQSGFKKFSENVGETRERDDAAGSIAEEARDLARNASDKLMAAGIDADGAIGMAEDRIDDLQGMVLDEIRKRPLRAIGWAVAAGFVLGIMSAR
jgi:hypothetical protein